MQVSPDPSVFGDASSPYLDAVEKIIAIVTEQQASTAEDGDHPHHNFSHAEGTDERYPNPEARVARCGLSKCGFRPSDDSTGLAFLIPSNAMAATELANTAVLLDSLADPRAPALAAAARALGAEIRNAILTVAVSSGGLFAYEVNGFGQQHLNYDDANVPSLLSLPYVGFVDASDPTYVATRANLLSNANPYYFEGTEGSGIGSPHTPDDYIWPMAVSLQALTSVNDTEISSCLATLKRSALETGLMHESFFKDDAAQFTRPWFAWANSIFGELIIKLANEKPYLILADA